MNDNNKYVFIGLGLGALAVALFSSFTNKSTNNQQPTNKNMNKGKTDSFENRGGASFAMFNMNPLNIKPQRTPYPGEITAQGAKHAMFESWTHGTAGAMIRLWQYLNGKVDGGVYPQFTKLDTVEEIIRTWAPASDGNDTEGYIQFIVRNMPIARDERIRWAQEDISALVAVMAVREDRVAEKFVTDDVLLGAWEIASKYVLNYRFY
jgi:hypothetical protein